MRRMKFATIHWNFMIIMYYTIRWLFCDNMVHVCAANNSQVML